MMVLSRKKFSNILFTVAGVASVSILTACGGGDVGSASSAADESGFEFGAPQEEVDKVVEELDPITIVLQSGTSSPDSPTAARDHFYKEAVEARSDGKISVDIVWGQAIAGYSELDEALADGRVDVAFHAPLTNPSQYSAIEAESKLTQYSSPAPLSGEAIAQSIVTETSWANDDILDTFESLGLHPLLPVFSAGDYWIACNSPGIEPSDWTGRQIRVGNPTQIDVADALGGSGVSLEYTEVYEGLQRGTVDCTFTQATTAGSTGLLGVAPYVSTLSDSRMSGSGSASLVAGSSFTEFPLAYQQILFDASADYFAGQLTGMMEATEQAVGDMQGADGEFVTLGSEVEETIEKTQEEAVDEMINEGQVPEDIREQRAELVEKWSTVVEELGYTDGGTLDDFTDWYDAETTDFLPLAEYVFEDVMTTHRPS